MKRSKRIIVYTSERFKKRDELSLALRGYRVIDRSKTIGGNVVLEAI